MWHAQAVLNRQRIQSARREWQRHDTDTGSPEVQVTLLVIGSVFIPIIQPGRLAWGTICLYTVPMGRVGLLV